MIQKTIKYILVIFFSVVVNPSFFNESNAMDKESDSSHSIGKDRAILVTGASSGIGKIIAMHLSKQGFFVYAGARKDKDIKILSDIPNMQGIKLDVTKQSDIDAAVKEIKAREKGLYGLVNNAGVFLFDPLIEVSERDMKFIMDVNVLGPYRVTKAFAPMIIEQQGRITSIGSVAGLFSGSLFGPYGMSKFAVEAYTEALAGEMKKFNVAVSVIEPGNFRSNIMKNMASRMEAYDKGEKKTLFQKEIKRFTSFTQEDRSHHDEPQPVADVVLSFMTSNAPQLRYLVTPNQGEADMTIKKLIQKLVDVNKYQRFRMTDKSLVEYLKEQLSLAQ